MNRARGSGNNRNVPEKEDNKDNPVWMVNVGVADFNPGERRDLQI
jgi:hypothetical protein